MVKRARPQNYPRIEDETDPYNGYLDTSSLVPHKLKISMERLYELIQTAITNANLKSSREILSIPETATPEQIEKIYETEGRKLLKYFSKYSNDPASVAHQMYGKHYREVGIELFRNQSLQKERMNSAWRYQYLTIYCAHETGRFSHISDIGTNEGDFSAKIDFVDHKHGSLNLYVSIKNKSNTVGGQDMPKVIQALETVAMNDKNRVGPYLCVLGVTIERGNRTIRHNKQGIAYSTNTEMWLADFFWPFFANLTYEEVMTATLAVLVMQHEANPLATQVQVPETLLNAFGKACTETGLVDDNGIFHDRYKLVHFLCNPPSTSNRQKPKLKRSQK